MSWAKEAVVIDFETLPIGDRPVHPPAPVGVAVDWPGRRKPRYYAWGHPTGGNTHTLAEARATLGEAYASRRPLLFHNARFDLEVAEAHLGLSLPAWERVHDTLPGLFLLDPRAESFALKPSAERLLGEPPTERDAVEAWLLENQPVPGIKLSASKKGKHPAGAYIAYAPPAVVGPYAVGDVTRTRKLAAVVERGLRERGMAVAYDRERELSLQLLIMEQTGLPVDVARLERDVTRYQRAQAKLEAWLLQKLRVKDPEGFNLDSGPQLVKALVAAKLVKEEDLGYTEKEGHVKTDKEAFKRGVKDPQLLATLTYRTQLNTCLRTFMKPWLLTAQSSGGRIFTSWHATRTDRRGGGVGTRTGRLSSTPNLQNVPVKFEAVFRTKVKPPVPLPPLPAVRSYIVAAEGWQLGDRDFSQQELRILGHFEDGVLCEAYNRDPTLDVHSFAQDLINRMLNANWERKPVKNTGFGLIYGMGVGRLAESNAITVDEAKELKEAYLSAFPGLRAMYREMKERAAAGAPIRTWGGREYFCEEPKVVNGRLRKFDYKLLNVLIQGSAADHTKEAVLRYCRQKPKHHQVLATVHDEVLVHVPRRELPHAMKQLKEAMESVRFDVPMLSEGKAGHNWAQMESYPE